MFNLTRAVYNSVLARLEESTRDISEKIGEAAAQGDLKENAEYHAAREKLSFTEAIITRMRGDLAEEEPTVDGSSDKVRLHSLVTVKNGSGKLEKFIFCQKLDAHMIEQMQDVGLDDGIDNLDCVTLHSPVGTEILGRKVGDSVSIGSIVEVDSEYFSNHSLSQSNADILDEVVEETLQELGVNV